MHRTFARIVSYAIAGGDLPLAEEQTAAHDRVIPQTFGSVLRQYPRHAESKSLAPDGTPCAAEHAASCNAPT